MHIEGALRFGSSSLLLTDRLCSIPNGPRCPSHRVNLVSKTGRPVCETNKQFPNFDGSMRNNVTDMAGPNTKVAPFVTNALTLRESEQLGGSNLASYCVSAENSTEISSRRSPSAPGGERPHQSGPVLLLARAPADELTAEEKEERIRQLKALAGLRQGRILGESQVFRQTCVIRSYEVSADGTTSIDTILSLFQEVALNHVSLLGIAGDGFGATHGMNRNRLIWVITRLHVEVDRYPTWPEAVEIDSWVGSAGKNGMRRDWLLREHATGHVIAKATSTWAMMHKDTRRLSKIPEDVKAEIVPVFIDKHAMDDLTLERIAKLDNSAQNIQSNLTSSRADLDVNQHINNVTYVRWVMESTPPATLETHEVSNFTLEYRRECNKDDVVESLTNPEIATLETPGTTPESSAAERGAPLVNGTAHGEYSNGSINSSRSLTDSTSPSLTTLRYTHLLRMQSKGEEIVRGRTVWRRKNQ